MANLDQIYAMLEAIDEKVDSLLLWKAAHNEQHKTITRDITDVRKTLYGNPNGLVSKVQRLLNCKNQIQIRSWKEFWMGILAGIIKVVVAAAIIGLVGWLLFIYKNN